MPRKMTKLGQHFLIDHYTINMIVGYIAANSNYNLVEIGPGMGALTIPVLGLGHNITAIELDTNIIPKLQAKSGHNDRLKIINKDALHVDFSDLPHDLGLCVFGNLPYQISALLMLRLGQHHGFVKKMIFMVQKEVALRLAASPGTHEYGRLSVMVQAWCDVKIVLAVAKDCFSPPPKVESSVFMATPKVRVTTSSMDWDLFEKVVRVAFRHKRKMCYSSFKQFLTVAQWQGLGFSATLRPSDLSVEDYISLTKYIQNNVSLDLFSSEA
jgi:16S rRNA (adenine1518-N6/adenine1519-N6)-dimethyltransferase